MADLSTQTAREARPSRWLWVGLGTPGMLWRRLAPAVLLLGATLWLFRDTAVAMVAIWHRSDAFAHASRKIGVIH